MSTKAYIKALKKYAKGYKPKDILSSDDNGVTFICQNDGNSYIITIMSININNYQTSEMQLAGIFDRKFDLPIRFKYNLHSGTNINSAAFLNRFKENNVVYYVRKIKETDLIELSMNQTEVVPFNKTTDYDPGWKTDSTFSNPEASNISTEPPNRPIFRVPTWLALLVVLLIAGTIILLCMRPWMAKVPSVIAKSIMEAEYLLSESDLNMVITNSGYYNPEIHGNTFIPVDSVLTQAPTDGNKLNKNSEVWVEVSQGKRQVYMPDMTGMLLESTEQALENVDADGISLELKYEYSDRDMVGIVSSQSIGYDEAADHDGKLILTVSLGPEMLPTLEHSIALENYTGRQFEEVKSELIESGIYLVKSAAVYSTEYEYGEIITQSPAAGDIIKSGDALYVVTSLGTEKARVPNVKYLEVEEAKEKLLAAGLLYEIHYVVDPTVKLGHVVSQNITPGNRTPFKAVIVLEVSGNSAYTEETHTETITLDTENMTLSVGDQVKLKYTYNGSEKINFKSSNEHILTVDENGNVSALRFGTATIVAHTRYGMTVCTVFVNDESRVSSIQELRLKVGEKVSLASSIPELIRNEVVWRSTNPKIASVSESGEVTANGLGFTQIFASHKNQMTSCDIVVAPEYIALSKETMRTLSGAESLLKAKNVEYTITEVYSQTYSKNMVVSVIYSGYSDNEYYYVSPDTTVTIKVSLGQTTLTDITVKTTPNVTTYYTGDALNTSGLTLNAKYSDGSEKTIKSGFTCSPTELSKVGTQKITVSYGGKTASFDVTVIQAELKSITIKTNPNVIEYFTGSNLQTAGLTLTANYIGGRSQTVSSGYTCSPTTLSKEGTQKITVTYGGKTTSFNVTVRKADIVSIAVKTNPTKTSYYSGDTLDTTGLTLEVKYNDGSVKTVSSGYVCSHTLLTSVSTQKITVTYGGKSTSFNVSVTEKKLIKIGAATHPKKLSYNVGEALDTAGLNIVGVYNDGSQENINSGYTCSPIKFDKAGIQTVTITYQGLTTNFTVTVLEAEVTAIKMESEINLKAKETYKLNPTIEPSNAPDKKITYTTSDKTIATVDKNGLITAVKAGSAQITAKTSNGKTAICKVTVKTTETIQFDTMPTKTEYYLGDTFSSAGLRLRYRDENGKYTTISSGFAVSSPDTKTEGTKTVTVTYKGLTLNYDITVKTPSIKVIKETTNEGMILYVVTEPANMPVKWFSTNDEIFYFEIGRLIPNSSGTAYACATMVYNGVEYTDFCPVTVVMKEMEAYYIEIQYELRQNLVYCSISTNIPNFDYSKVQWTVSQYAEYEINPDGGCYVYFGNADFVVVGASYVHNGRPYTDQVTIP